MSNQNYLSFSTVSLWVKTVEDLLSAYPTLTRFIFVPHVVFSPENNASLGLCCYVADDESFLNANLPATLLFESSPANPQGFNPGVYIAFNLISKTNMQGLLDSTGPNEVLTFDPQFDGSGKLYYTVTAPPTPTGASGSTIDTNPSPPAPFS